jgi:hypothetical protein
MSRSGVQLEVLRLFRGFLREIRLKPLESQQHFKDVLFARFYQDAKIPKYDSWVPIGTKRSVSSESTPQ